MISKINKKDDFFIIYIKEIKFWVFNLSKISYEKLMPKKIIW
jgi:hypothetical protein